MIPPQLLQRIESAAFVAEAGAASSRAVFDVGTRQHDAVQQLLAHLETPANREQVVARAAELLNRETDWRYEHPHDTALAVYVGALALTEAQLGALVASAAVAVPNLWWTRQIAAEILDGSSTRSASAPTTSDDIGEPATFSQNASEWSVTYSVWSAPSLPMGQRIYRQQEEPLDVAA